MSSLRNFGYKIFSLLNTDPIEKKRFCEKLNLSEADYTRLIYGRLAVNPVQIEKIASFFSIQPEDLVTYKNSDYYSKMVHCMSSFSTQEHCDEILDIIDSYIDIKEAASQNFTENL